jgi:hypothetical protein
MRIVLLLTSLLFAACTVGEVDTASNGGGPDAGPGGGSNGSGSNANGCANLVTPAEAHPHGGVAGAFNAGLNCLMGGCHLNNQLGKGPDGTPAPGYQFAGTLYKSGTNPLQPYAGATIHLKSGAMTLTAITDTAGNFSFAAGSLPGTFTATTDATACPTLTPMVTNLVSGGGAGANSCNLCHTTGAGALAPPITL